MITRRMERVNELLKREIGAALFRLGAADGFDLAELTVTRVTVSRDLREARVMISVRSEQPEFGRALAALRRCRAELQSTINLHLRLKYTPRLSFQIDRSILKGDNVLKLLAEMENEAEPIPEPSAQAGSEAQS